MSLTNLYMKTNFKITNIDCEACVKLSNSALKNLSGVTNVQIEKSGIGSVESDRDIAWEEIESALAQVDKKAVLI